VATFSSATPVDASQMARDARALFSDGPLAARTVQHLRPFICPFHTMLTMVPDGASVLDVGCGSGLFLGLLAKRGGLRAGYGFDSSAAAIALARKMRNSLPATLQPSLRFECLDVGDAWPAGTFDVVSLIDVMHHVPSAAQQDLLATAISHVAPGGVLLYKDMAAAPLPYALANRLHDLVMARQWITYAPLANIRRWGLDAGLELEREGACRMLWFAHEWLAFRKPIPDAASVTPGEAP